MITGILLCGGWHKRYLEDVNGEPLVCRNIRLLRELGVDRIIINISWHKEDVTSLFSDKDKDIIFHVGHHHYLGVKNGVPEWIDDDERTDWKGTNYVESLHPIMDTLQYWSDTTIILLCDVYFTKGILREMLEYPTDDVVFFGKNYSKPDGKVLGDMIIQ